MVIDLGIRAIELAGTGIRYGSISHTGTLRAVVDFVCGCHCQFDRLPCSGRWKIRTPLRGNRFCGNDRHWRWAFFTAW